MCLELLQKGYEILVLDDLSNGSLEALKRVQNISGKEVLLSIGNIRSKSFLDEAFASFKPDTVMHFAGLKAVEESMAEPLKYFDVNVVGSLRIISAMNNQNCKI